jgi:two-component system sensor histidine kinase LytS
MSLMVLIAYLLTKLQLVKTLLRPIRQTKSASWPCRHFGLVGILSTYTGIRVQGAIANTRVIGVIAAEF